MSSNQEDIFHAFKKLGNTNFVKEPVTVIPRHGDYCTIHMSRHLYSSFPQEIKDIMDPFIDQEKQANPDIQPIYFRVNNPPPVELMAPVLNFVNNGIKTEWSQPYRPTHGREIQEKIFSVDHFGWLDFKTNNPMWQSECKIPPSPQANVPLTTDDLPPLQPPLQNRRAVAAPNSTVAPEKDPFYERIRQEVLAPVVQERNRIHAKDPKDKRIAELTTLATDIEQKISDSIHDRKVNRQDATLSKSICKDYISTAINNHTVNSKAYAESWGVKFGKALLNTLIAIPAVVRSMVSDKTINESFYSFKKSVSLGRIEETKKTMDNIESNADAAATSKKSP